MAEQTGEAALLGDMEVFLTKSCSEAEVPSCCRCGDWVL